MPTTSRRRSSIAAVTIAVVDRRAHPVGPSVADGVAAVNTQIERDFAPAWGLSARLVVKNPAPSDWRLYLVDRSSEGIGYHTVEVSGGKRFVVGYVSGGTGFPNWPITASHEALEMLGDPFVNKCDHVPNTNYSYIQEVCDPVEDLVYRIKVTSGGVTRSIPVSDFVFPSWFGLSGGPQDQFDFLRNCGAAFRICKGYIKRCRTVSETERCVSIEIPNDAEIPPSIFRGNVSQADAMLLTEGLNERFAGWEKRLKTKKGLERFGYIEIASPAAD